MRTLKTLINRYIFRITGSLVVTIVIVVTIFQFNNEQKRIYDNALGIFSQMEQVLAENENELNEVREEYKRRCLDNAEVIAQILEADSGLLYNSSELQELARRMEVDEIHLIDTMGCIFSGTKPEYYGYTFDSGEQIGFFKPMLSDKSLKLVQDITENTAEAKPMQYSAVWNESGTFIVQVGMEPVNVKKATEKNELSYIFSLFRVNPEANYYAIDEKGGMIIASTNLDAVGKKYNEVGFLLEKIQWDDNGFHAKISGVYSFCVFKNLDDTYIGRVVSSKNVYGRVPIVALELFLCLIIIVVILAKEVSRHMNQYVVGEIGEMKAKLKSIAEGNLEENVNIRSSVEFSELSDYINSMVRSLLQNNTKMSYVLKKTNLNIGVYEYNAQMQNVSMTGDVMGLLSLGEGTVVPSQVSLFTEYVNEVRKHTVEDEVGIYQTCDNPERYIRLAENTREEETFGVIIDVTTEVIRRRKIEVERDIDALTGLYNRRGLDTRLTKLFAEPDKLGHSAVVMIDADGLKEINDTYGHEIGDIYLKEIAEIIHHTGVRKSVVSRMGGDEFVLFLYGYNSREELHNVIQELEEKQSGCCVYHNGDLTVSLRFSMGYSYVTADKTYSQLLKDADGKMYCNKTERKKYNFIRHN